MPTFVQHLDTEQVPAGSTVIVLTPAAAVTVGDVILVMVAAMDGDLPQPTSTVDSQGNTYNNRGFASSLSPNRGIGLTVCKVTHALGTSDTITLTMNSGAYVAIAAEFADMDSLVDGASGQHGTGLASGGNTSLSPFGNLSWGGADAVFGGVVCTDPTAVLTPPAGWTEVDHLQQSPNGTVIVAYGIKGGAGSEDPQVGYTGAGGAGWDEVFFSFLPHTVDLIDPTSFQEEAFGFPTLSSGHEIISEAGFSWSEEFFGEPTLVEGGTPTISPPSVPSSEAFGRPLLFETAPPPGPRPPTPRNYLIDAKTGEVYPWPVNHSSEDSIKTLGRRLTRSGISASGRLLATRQNFLIRRPSHQGPIHLVLHGSMMEASQDQYQHFVRFFESCDDRKFIYLDSSGDSYLVVICQFDARRKASDAHTDGSFFGYTLDVEVLQALSGPYKGVAV